MVCPKCGAPIKWYDLSPNCKKCGVHIMYYTQEQDLILDAKRTELEFAKARAVVGRIKATYIGSKLAILRTASGVLTAAALAIPFMKLSVKFPMAETSLATGAVGAYKMFSSGLYEQLLNLIGIGADKALTAAAAAHIAFFVLAVLFELCMTLTFFLAAIDIRRGSKYLAIFTSCAMLSAAGTAVTELVLKSLSAGSAGIAVSIYPGAFVLLGIQTVFLIADIVMYRNNPTVSIPEVDQKRLELLDKVRHSEISYDDLPLPVFETEEERDKREHLFGNADM